MAREEAVDKTLAEIPENFLLRHILLKHKAEVKGMILTEYDEEDVMNGFREEGRQEGRQEGIISTLVGLVNDKLLSIQDASNRVNLSETEFKKLMESHTIHL